MNTSTTAVLILTLFIISILMPLPSAHSSLLDGLFGGDKTYENKEFGVKMQYPNDWKNSEEIGPVDYAPERIFSASFMSPANKEAVDMVFAWVSIERLGEEVTLEDRKNLLSKNLNGFPELSQTLTTLSGEQAVRTEYFNDDVGQKNIGIEAIKNNLLYDLSFTGDPDTMDKYKDSIQKMIDTLEITSIDSDTTAAAKAPPALTSTQTNCDSSYPDVCIASPPPILNCVDIPETDFSVVGKDPHGFDSEGDGIGCESVE